MISTQMKNYNYFTIGERDAYGQQTLSTDPKGFVKMSINIISQSITDNINYKDATYLGLTFDKNIDDTYVIKYDDVMLKVMYVNPMGRYRQVFLAEQ